MIYLTKGQVLFDNPGMVVYDPTGYYDDGSSVICAAAFAPDEPVCRYEAKFIAYGDLVYNITDPDKLMEEVIKIDPKSLFNKSSKDVALDTVVENIQTVESGQPEAAQESVPPQDQAPIAPITNPDQVESVLASTTPTTLPETNISTTTPVSTEAVVPIVPDVPVENTLEEIIPIVENVIENAVKVKEITESLSTTTPLTEITF